MKFVYIANLRLPTEKAYGIQIVKMCEAFANQRTEVVLIFPDRKNSDIKSDIFDYYFVRRNFKFKKIQAQDFYWPGFLDKISFFIKNYFSAKALVEEALKENADIYYTRDERIAYILNKEKRQEDTIIHCMKVAFHLFS